MCIRDSVNAVSSRKAHEPYLEHDRKRRERGDVHRNHGYVHRPIIEEALHSLVMTRGLKDIELIASGKRVSAAYRPKAGHDNKQRQRVYECLRRRAARFEALHGVREKQRREIYCDKGEQLYDCLLYTSRCV